MRSVVITTSLKSIARPGTFLGNHIILIKHFQIVGWRMDFVSQPKTKVSKQNKPIYKFSDCFRDAI